MNEEIYRINQESDTIDLVKFHLCGTTNPDKNYRINRPDSEIFCIEYIEDGCGTVHLDNEIFYPRAGDSYFLQAGKSQYYYSDPETPWKKHFVNISGKLVEHLAEGYGVSNISHFEGLYLGDELKQIIAIAKDKKIHDILELTGLLNAMFFKMRSHVKKEDSHPGIGAQMKDFLDTQITSDFRMELLCKHISKSESQAIRLFKKLFGMTPYSYLLDQKISFGKKLLVDTGLSVKQISEKLCFSDEYYFSNIFKKKTGCTPTKYRMQQGKAEK